MLNRRFEAVITFTSTSHTRSGSSICEFKQLSVPFNFHVKTAEINLNEFETWCMNIEKKIEHFQNTFSKTYYKIDFSDSNEKNTRHSFRSLEQFKKHLEERNLIAPEKEAELLDVLVL